ncbi:MAG: hypothetical protein QXU39_01075 [Candidatus Pacearchaeota archaeon]
METEENVCKKCGGKKIIKEKDGTIHTCFECLEKGRLDQHDKNPKTAEELRIKL